MFKNLNDRLKNLDVLDISLTKFAVFFATIFIVRYFRVLLNIPLRVLILLVILCAIRPMYRMWFKK